MKSTRTFLLFPLCCFYLIELLAQNEARPADTEYINQFFSVDAAGLLKSLERLTPQVKGKMRIGGGDYFLVVPGRKSILSDSLTVIRTLSSGSRRVTWIQLEPFSFIASGFKVVSAHFW